FAGESQAAVRWLEQARLAVVEAQAQAVAAQQHQFAVDAGKRRKRRIALDLGDRKPPGPVATGIGALRVDLAGPAQAVAPALAAVLVGCDDAGHGRQCSRTVSVSAARIDYGIAAAGRGCTPDALSRHARASGERAWVAPKKKVLPPSEGKALRRRWRRGCECPWGQMSPGAGLRPTPP